MKILIVIETRIGNKIFSFSWRKLKDGTSLKHFCYKKIHILILIIILNISWNFYLNNAGFDKKKIKIRRKEKRERTDESRGERP